MSEPPSKRNRELELAHMKFFNDNIATWFAQHRGIPRPSLLFSPIPYLGPKTKAFARRLASRKEQERLKTEQEILAMGTEGRTLLIAIMRHEVQQRNHRLAKLYRVFAGTALLNIYTILIKYFVHGRLWMHLIEATLGIVVLIPVLRLAIVSRVPTNTALLLVKHYDGVDIIGPMAEALEYRGADVREAVATALIRLLPLVKENDEVPLTASERSSLYRALMGDNPELVLAILGSLGLDGDSKVLPNIRKLASGLGTGASDIRVREAAQRTLELHKQLREAHLAPNTLLRAASTAPIGTDVLLRPALELLDMQADILLRPASVSIGRDTAVYVAAVPPAIASQTLLCSVSNSTEETS